MMNKIGKSATGQTRITVRRRMVGTTLALAGTAFIGACTVPAPAVSGPAHAVTSSSSTSHATSSAASAGTINTSAACLAWQFVDAANELRHRRSMPALTMLAAATTTAAAHSSVMSRSGSIRHSNLTDSANRGFGVKNWDSAGENVGKGATMPSVQNALVASPSHFAAIVNPQYDAVGIGVVVSGSKIYVTELFGNVRTMPNRASRPHC